jgi:hypothetical protein
MIEAELNKWAGEFVNTLRNNLISAGKSATGNLVRSINYRLVQNGDQFSIVFEAADYLEWVDKGRKPGKMPPYKKLIPWVESRGLRFAKTSDSMAFVIARSIAKKGIKPLNVIERTKQSTIQNLKTMMTGKMKENIIKMIKEI